MRRPDIAPVSQAASEKSAGRLKRIASGAAFVALAAGVLVAVAIVASRDEPKTQGAFGQHYEGLEQRRQQAGVSTMADPADDGVHLHPKLAVFVDGERVLVPANIGIDPSKPSDQMAGLHTHTDDGTIHVEGAANSTLGRFFQIWGVPFSKTRVGPHRAGAGRVVQMWVDGRPSSAFERLRLADDQRITVGVGARSAREPRG